MERLPLLVVPDATVLITLAKMHRLRLLRDIYGEALIGPVVKTETIDHGKHIGARDVVEIEGALRDGWLRVIRPSAKERAKFGELLKTSRLDRGETESIVIAQLRKCLLIIDDKEARTIAANMNMEHIGTAGVLLDGYAHGQLHMSELEEAVRDLGNILWLSPAVAVEVLRVARSMKK